MPKGYWVVHVDVDNPEEYKKYVAANAVAFKKYGAKFLVRGGAADLREGSLRARTVVLEFKDLATAQACYDSPEYQAAKDIRLPHSTGDIVIVQGWNG